jgi:FkbM family methyltransferase
VFTSLKQILRHVLQRRGYELYRRPWLPKGTDPWETLHAIFPTWQPAMIFDVGANVGDVALQLATHFPSASLHAFEPVQATAARLRERVQSCARIQTHTLALGAEPARIAIQPQGESTLNSLRAPAERPADSSQPLEIVEVVTLDSFCAAHGIAHIDLLKSDTEGYELAVLAGGSRLLAAGAIDAILVEAGLVPGEARFTPLTALAEVLQPHGFLLVGIFDQHGWRHRLGAEFCNALFIRTAVLPP